MAVIEYFRPTHQIGHFFAGLSSAISNWNDARVTRNALSRLSDHELDDLGLTRGDIENFGGDLIR